MRSKLRGPEMACRSNLTKARYRIAILWDACGATRGATPSGLCAWRGIHPVVLQLFYALTAHYEAVDFRIRAGVLVDNQRLMGGIR